MPGLEADNLLAFLAMLGLLRALETARPKWRPRISWKGPPWIAHLHVLEIAGEMEVSQAADEGCFHLAKQFECLVAQFDENDRKNVSFGRDRFRYYAKLARDEDASAALVGSLTAEWPEKKAGGLQAAPLVMMFGQGHQNFLERLVAVPRGDLPSRFKKAKSPPDMRAPTKIGEALFGPWRREDDADGFRWDPEDDQRYALRYDDPSGAGAALTMHGANRLAAIGFLSFVTAPGEMRMMAAGAVRQDGWSFVWPIWNVPLSRVGIEALLSHPDVLACRREKLRCLGVDEILRARRIANGKFMNVTRAQPMASEGSERENREAKPRGSRVHRQVSRA